jgi:eukaryotic-like serine/threonine-protein kinase
MKTKNFLWIFPFLFFVLGYCVLYFLFQKNEVNTPDLIGKNLYLGAKLLAEKGLSLKLLKEQEETDLPEGIILDQIPKAGQKIKSTQNILVTVSKKPAPLLAPEFLGLKQEEVLKKSIKLGIQAKSFWLKSFYPKDVCIAQYPCAGQIVNEKKMTVFLSSGQETLCVVPDFKGHKISQLQDLFKKENVNFEVFHTHSVENNHTCVECKVVDQKPIPGSIVDLSKKLFVQLQVE